MTPQTVYSTEAKPKPPKLLDQVRERLRLKHYSIRTEAQYVQWIRRYILFHGKRHPRDMGASEVEAFLTHLAVEGNVAASTQNQALSALLFLYREVLNRASFYAVFVDDCIRVNVCFCVWAFAELAGRFQSFSRV